MIQIGNRVELYLEHEMEQEQKTGEKAHVYQSQVSEIYEDGDIELYMPREAGKAVLFPLRIRLVLLFDADGGCYRAIGLVEERYRSNNSYMLRVALKSQLYRYHRCTYCGVTCAMDMAYFVITKEQALQEPPLQLQKLMNTRKKGIVQKKGMIQELCGAHVRFQTDTENERNSYILIQIQQNLIPAYILSSEVSPADSGCFTNEAELIYKDSRAQEDIIRYIFDEKRKNRKKQK